MRLARGRCAAAAAGAGASTSTSSRGPGLPRPLPLLLLHGCHQRLHAAGSPRVCPRRAPAAVPTRPPALPRPAANEYTSFNQCCRDSFNRAANVPILGNGMTSFDCYASTRASAVNNGTTGGLRAAATQQQQQKAQQKAQGRRLRQ
jgi:hypothetical protein